MKRNRVLDYTVYVVARVLVCIAQTISLEIGRSIARQMAWLFADVLRIRRNVVHENLLHAFPEMSQSEVRRLVRRMWEHLFLLVLEVAHVPRKIHETNWRRYVRLKNVDRVVQMLLGDRPIVMVTAHYGNFEVGGFMLGLLGFPTFTVARNLDNPYLDRFVSRFRGATGQFIIPKNGGYDQILDVLAAGGTMSFLADQYAGPKGAWVQFFGRPASAYKAIALFSMEHDAPVAVCGARRLACPLQFEMECLAVADPRDAAQSVASIHEMTQWYTSKLEEMIRRAPEQYWWLHRRWKDTRPPRRERVQAA
jgi:KDO2-lipid IV(A) lauroyltransferase